MPKWSIPHDELQKLDGTTHLLRDHEQHPSASDPSASSITTKQEKPMSSTHTSQPSLQPDLTSQRPPLMTPAMAALHEPSPSIDNQAPCSQPAAASTSIQ
ncbi:hypothetical protein ACLOJK_019050 [Asimina triloba]